MNDKKFDAIWLGVSMFSFLLLSCSFLLMPIEGNNMSGNGISVFSLIAGILFWFSLFVGIVTQCVLSVRRKKWYMAHRIKKTRAVQRVGVISFFQNVYGAIADIIVVISFIAFVISLIVSRSSGYACYVFLALLVFSFSMHCILNGKFFYYILNQDKVLKSANKERTGISKSERREKND